MPGISMNGLVQAGGFAVDAASTATTAGMAIAGSHGLATATGAAQSDLNAIQDQMAVKSMEMQILAAARSMMVQAVRDLVKDAKDCIKDQGEAGHKP